ncbi:MAG: sodium:proton antiporter [Gammaproteobacteria bacterium]|nr:sodium:proton antiporter [Gammaproteobacteria bacterium]
MIESLKLVLALVVFAGAAAQWLAWRFQVPAIVLLSVVGILLGPVSGLVQPEVHFGDGLREIVAWFVALILFEGGLNLRLHELKEAGTGVRRLIFVGVAVAWVLGSAASYFIGGLSLPTALLFGAIIVVTGPTVIMPLLRHAHLKRKVASMLKWEGIVNDPIGVLLAVFVYQYFVFGGGSAPFSQVLVDLILALSVAVSLGGGIGWLLGVSFERNWVPEYLKAPAAVAVVSVIYALSDIVQHESGLMAATLAGVVMGNMKLRSIGEMRRFKEYITIMMVSFLFVVLTAGLHFSVLGELSWRLVALVAVLVFVVRPLAVWLATIGSGLDWQERVFIGWIAPRGVVAAASAGAFSLPMVEAGYADAELLVPLVFVLIFSTVTLHGLSLGWVATKLGLKRSSAGTLLIAGSSPWSVELASTLKALGVSVLLADNAWHRLRAARERGLETWYGEVLSEKAEEELELEGVEMLLASTSNDAYNALACNAFSPDLGPHKVFQLPMLAGDDDPQAVSDTRRGLPAFKGATQFEELWECHIRGWQFQKTRLTDEFTYLDAVKKLPEEAIQLALVSADGNVRFAGDEVRWLPDSGYTLVSYVPPNPTQRSLPIE